MSDRRNRRILGLIGLLLLAGGGLSVCLGAGVFGSRRANRAVLDPTVVRWWYDGGWISFAVVVVVGVVIAVAGVALVLSQLRRNDGKDRTPTVTFPTGEATRGATTLRTPALSHSIETDLQSIPDVHKAMVGLFGRYPDTELRAVLEIADDADLEHLPRRVDEVLDRLEDTVGRRPDPVLITVRFKSADLPRQLA